MASNTSNLDISQVDNAELEELSKQIEAHYRSDSSVKAALSYHWERNHLMLDGKQWIVYDGERGRGGSWKELTVSRANEYIPRPVTNYVFDIYQTLKSYLIQHRPRSSVAPNTQTYKDKQAAKLAHMCSEANWERLKEEKNYEYASSVCIAYGTVFKKDYWDTSTLQMARVPRMAEQPITDPATGAVVGYEEKEVVDPETGDTIFDEMPLGDVNTAVVEPYRIAMDPLATDLHTARWIMEYSIQSLDYVREMYDRDEPGFTGRVKELKPETSLSASMQRFYQLKNSSGVKKSGSSGGSAGSEEMVENSVVLKEHYSPPTRKYPKGRLVVVANGLTLYADRSPYEGPEMGDWHPYSECRWEIVPGRFWGKSPLDPVVEIQKHINSIDATIILTRKTMAIPQKLIPKNSGIKPGEWTGRPGLEVFYRSDGAAPTTVEPTGVDAQVFQERAQKLEDMKNISGAIDILKGDRPPGVTAASALEMLFEVGTGKLRPALERWKQFVECSQKKQLRLVGQKYKEPRPEFIRVLMAKNKELSKEMIEKFLGTDLLDNFNVTIEAGSNIPKLMSAEKAQLMQMAQIGTLNLESPQNKMEFNRRLGVIGFDNEVGPDVKRAEWENDLLDNSEHAEGNQPVVLADELHLLHKEIHLRRMKEPSFLQASEVVQNAYTAHIAEHDFYMDQQKEAAMLEAAVTGQPPAPQGGPEQIPLKSAGPGAPKKTAEKIAGADIPRAS